MSKADERFIALCEKNGVDPNAIVDALQFQPFTKNG